ncbi:ATP-binding protein [Kribbella ginsengisoli]|uniref:HTH luxR-type domain-containing protein n=1 Tax=Kribbella ginsengisoli TaxID=363865 RepID=A0ABP6YUH0_9ACTN
MSLRAVAGLPEVSVTVREAEVLRLVSRRLTNAEIAQALVISERTAESHVASLLRKFNLRNRQALARRALALPAADQRRLPTPVTAFVGRTTERQRLTACLGEHRLVTASGPGGIGKTRLALSVASEAAADYPDGVWFVDLAQLTDPAMVGAVIADALGIPDRHTATIDSSLIAYLRESKALLVLDNCEHVVNGARSWVARILSACPAVHILATSRCRLMLSCERVFVVPSMSTCDGVELFNARVATAIAGSDVPDQLRVAELCQALEGLALAIELAAARYPTLSLDGLEIGLDARMQFFSSGAHSADEPRRHSSLRSALDWSYRLLPSEDQSLLRTISLFTGWFDVDAASTVSGQPRAAVADGLARLVDHSLLMVERGDPTQYRALETIRQYGAGLLEDRGDLKAAAARLERWCLDSVRSVHREAIGSEADGRWRQRFERVLDDSRASLSRRPDSSGRRQKAELARELGAVLFVSGRPSEAQARYEQAAGLHAQASDRVDDLRMAAGAAATRLAGNDALRLYRTAAELAMSIDDRYGAVRDLATMAMYIVRAPGMMSTPVGHADAAGLLAEAGIIAASGAAESGKGRAADPDSARALASLTTASGWVSTVSDITGLEPARDAVTVAYSAGDGIARSAALDLLCSVHLARHELNEAIEIHRKRKEVVDQLAVGPDSGYELSDYHKMASDMELAAGDLVAARAHAEAHARLQFHGGEDHLAVARQLRVDALSGSFDAVVVNSTRFRRGWERAGRPAAANLGPSTYAVAMVHGILGDEQQHAEWSWLTSEIGVPADELNSCTTGWAPVFDAMLALHSGKAEIAFKRLCASPGDVDVWRHWSSGLWLPWYSALWAEAAVLAGHESADSRISAAQEMVCGNPITAAIVARAKAFAAGNHEQLEVIAKAFAQLGCGYQQTRTSWLSSLPAISGHG